MKVPFTKASACGNDFLIMDGADAPADLHEFSKRICDRHNGVGADGVEWLFPASDADIRARLINAMAVKRKFPATAPAASPPIW